MNIYLLKCLVNGKQYIGKTTKSIDDRFKDHVRNSVSGDTHLYRAMRKHGVESFSVICLESDIQDLSTLNDREIYWIEQYNTFLEGYNMTLGGDGGDASNSPKFIKYIQERETTKGLTYEEIYGYEKAQKLRHSRSASNTRREQSGMAKSWHKKQGVTLSERYKNGEISIGQGLRSSATCIHCGKVSNPGNIARWHNNNCANQ